VKGPTETKFRSELVVDEMHGISAGPPSGTMALAAWSLALSEERS